MKIKFFLYALATVLMSGCVYNEDYFLSKKEQFQVPLMDKDRVADMPFTALGDPEAHQNFKKLTLGFAVSDKTGLQFIGHSDIPEKTKEDVKKAFLPFLQKVYTGAHRFNILSIYNTDGHRELKHISEQGIVDLPESEVPTLDRLVSLAFTVSTDTKVINGPIRLKTYTVRCNYNEIDAGDGDGAISKEADYCEGYSYIRYNVNKQIVDDSKYILAACYMAAEQLYRKLYMKYLPGGRITGMLGNNMTLNTGTNDGISANEQMQVYTIINNTVLPLAYATAQPHKNTSNLEVWRWNTSNKFAKQIIRQMQNDINFIKNGDVIYAISMGVPAPIASPETKE